MSDKRSAGPEVHPAPSEWLPVGQAARFLGVAQSTIRKWSDQGRIPAFYTPGGHRRFRRSDLETFVSHSGPSGEGRGEPLVLVVDGDPRLSKYIRANLEVAGYSVREARNGVQALATIDDQAPDLLLLDVGVPGVDGWQLLRQLEEHYGSIPVLMFSGQVDESGNPAAAVAGTTGFVRKPFDPEELLARAQALVPIHS
jgi:excisionase family DNA binding protein